MDQPLRYCRNYGAELRPGTEFCVSCEMKIESETEQVATDSGAEWGFCQRGSDGAILSIYQKVMKRKIWILPALLLMMVLAGCGGAEGGSSLGASAKNSESTTSTQ